MFKRFVVVVVLVGVSRVAGADALDVAVKKAVREYAAGSFKKAIATLKKIVERGGDAKKRALAYRLLGASYVSINKDGDASASFRKAIELDPEEGLDANRYPPSIVEFFVGVKAKMRGKLTIKCDREDAQVEIDGRPAGKCGEAQDVPSGKRKVVVTSKGKSQERTIYVAVDGSVTEEVKFGPSTGKIAIDSVPKGATVSIGEKEIGKTPIENYEVDAGEYVVVIELAGFAPIREKVVIEAGGVKAILKPLEKAAGTTATVATVPPKTTTTTTTTTTPPKTTTTAVTATPPKTTTTTTTISTGVVKKPSRWMRTWGWALVGVGGLSTIVGFISAIKNLSAKSDDDALTGNEPNFKQLQAEYQERADDTSTIANITLWPGLVLTIAGGVLLILDATSKKSVAESPLRVLGIGAVRDARGVTTPMLQGAWRF
ncbi:MAG: PEGA domain-containing protein [Deltaproteobacteria bacterium]|nr:PEGA domain-containing protein [Deltaproteobacteria bacterium]